MKWKRLCAVMTAFAMSMTMLAGCGKKPDHDAGTAGSDGDTGKETAMGRYVETEVALPGDTEDLENRSVSLIQREDGRIFLYAVLYDDGTKEIDVLCYEWTAGGWEEQQSGLHQARLEGDMISFLSIQQADDGTEYMSYVDWGTFTEEDLSVNTYIMKVDPDRNRSFYTDTPVKTSGGADYVYIFSDGSLMLSDFSNGVHRYKDGSEKNRLEQGIGYSNIRALVTARSMEYITTAPEGSSLIRYNMEHGTAAETIPMTASATDSMMEGVLSLDKEGNLYMCNASGIHYWKKGGSIWETLVDGNLSSLSMPSRLLHNMVLGFNQDYLVLTSEPTGGLSLLRYEYDPEVASVPSTTLSIFGLADNATVRQAISRFQKQYPDIRVDFQVGDGGDGGATVTDTIKALNTELVNKKGADILILDGLPVDDYIEKGVLADIGEVVNPMLEDQLLLESVAGFMKQDDQAVYGVPARFLYPLMYGNDEGMAAMQSLQSVRDYDGSLPLLVNKNHTELLKYLMSIYYGELFEEDGTITKENLVVLLETVQTLHERGVSPDMESSDDVKEVYNSVSQFGIQSQEPYGLFAGEAAVAVEILNSVHSIMISAEIMRQLEVAPTTANHIFFPVQVVGVNESSSQKELAKEFIRLLLSAEIQAAELHDGFPVNAVAFENWRTFRDDLSMIGTSIVRDDGISIDISASWPTQEQQDQIFALQKDMVTPVVMNGVLTEMITDEAKAFFDGRADAAGTADAIINRMALYFGE